MPKRLLAPLVRLNQISLLGDFECVIHCDAEVTHGGLKLRMSKQQLNRTQVLGALVERVAFVRRIECVPQSAGSARKDEAFNLYASRSRLVEATTNGLNRSLTLAPSRRARYERPLEPSEAPAREGRSDGDEGAIA